MSYAPVSSGSTRNFSCFPARTLWWNQEECGRGLTSFCAMFLKNTWFQCFYVLLNQQKHQRKEETQQRFCWSQRLCLTEGQSCLDERWLKEDKNEDEPVATATGSNEDDGSERRAQTWTEPNRTIHRGGKKVQVRRLGQIRRCELLTEAVNAASLNTRHRSIRGRSKPRPDPAPRLSDVHHKVLLLKVRAGPDTAF